MAITLVANVHTSATSSSINTTGATLLVAFQNSATTFSAPTDSKSNTWTALSTQGYGASTAKVGIYYAINPTVGSGHTFTCNSTGGPTLFISAWSGTLTTSAVFDNQSGNTTGQTSKTTIQPGSVAPVNAGEVFITGIATIQNSTESIDSSFTIQDTQFGFSNFCAWAYLIDATTAAQNPTWTPSGSSTMATVMAVFAPPVVLQPDEDFWVAPQPEPPVNTITVF